MMESLFSKIDAISVTETSLPADDQHAMDNLDFYLKDELENLDTAKADIENLNTQSAWLKEKSEDLLRTLITDREKVRQEHLQAVIEHFNNAHDLGLNTPYQWQNETTGIPDNELIKFATNWVQDQLGGKNFLEIATEKLAAEFRQRSWNVKRSRRHVTLGSFVHLTDKYGGGKRFDFRADDNLLLLAKALGRFERDNTSAPRILRDTIYEMCRGYDDPPFGETISTGLTKCSEMVIYKNGNLRLTFAAETEASAFTTFYNLKLTD